MFPLEKCYSRLLIDNHITDHDPKFMSRFEPAEYVRLVKLAGVGAAMVHSCDHNGNCYYPTRIGHMHAGLAGRDIFGETLAGLRREGVIPVGYYSAIYHNRAAVDHPEFRMRSAGGVESHGRYHYLCPNHPGSRVFFKEQLAEMLAYPVDGLFIDMTFWPLVCCCDACRAKWGKPFPKVIDWSDPEWVRFQRWRESSLAEFAAELTDHVRRLRPEISVTHQFSPVLHGWYLGQSDGIAAASDYASGDFYGGKLQHRFGIKAFAAFSRGKPLEFMTSRCVDLHDHTSTKSDDELTLHALTTLAHGGAYLFVDAVNPDGTLEEPFYRRLRHIVAALEPFTKTVARHRPALKGEVGLYFSMASCVDRQYDGTPLGALDDRRSNMDFRANAVLDEALGCSKVLTALHIPYRVVTERDADLSSFKAVIVGNAAYLGEEECARLREFVRGGGTLIATGWTSFYNRNGETSGNFALADLFGVDFAGGGTGAVNYLDCEGELISATGDAPLCRLRERAKELGRVVLPDFPADDPDRYASIHSNPPGKRAEFAGLVKNHYGKGTCIYLYSGLLKSLQHSQQSFGERLFKQYLPEFLAISRNFPPSAELTLLESEEPGTLLLGAVNYQEELPNLPLLEVELSLRLPEGFAPKSCFRASDGGEQPFRFAEGIFTVAIPRLDTAEIFTLTK